MKRARAQAEYPISRPLVLYAGIAILIATFINVALTSYNLMLLDRLAPREEQEYTYLSDDYPDQLPLPLPEVGLSLDRGNGHYSLYADEEWGSLFPKPGQGFVQLGPSNRTFVISMYHQLHCLDIIRVQFLVNSSHAAQHIEHCLRYLRQIILCKSDTTLERTISRVGPDGKMEYGAPGVGDVHRCQDWTKVREFLEGRVVDLEHGEPSLDLSLSV